MGYWTTPTSFFLFAWDFVLVWVLGAYFLAKQIFQRHNTPVDLGRRNGQVAIVTGGSRGIGLEIVKQFLSEGIHTIIVSSNTMNDVILKSIMAEFPNSKVEYYKVDISSTKSVRNFANKFLDRNLPLHILVNNAGIMFGPYKVTDDGFESQLSTNYLGHFLLTYLLLPKLIETGTSTCRSRIVNVSSCCHYAGYMNLDELDCKNYYSEHGSYARSKLAQVMNTFLLQEWLEKKNANVTVNAVHPGIIDTQLYVHTFFNIVPALARLIFKTPREGADGVVHVALSQKLEGCGGKYFENCQAMQPNKIATVRLLQVELWRKTCQMLSITDFNPEGH